MLILASAPITRAAGTYFKVQGLFNHPGDISVQNVAAFKASLKNNTGFAAALGYKFTLLRAEAELQYFKGNAEAEETNGTLFGGIGRTIGDVKETSGFANVYVDFPSFLGLAPYVGAGLGYARINFGNLARTRNDVPIYQFSGRDSVYGYQGMLGLQYHLPGTATIHGGYRIVKRQDIAVRDVLANASRDASLGDNHIFELGVSMGF